ncbi:MAG: hypothetical protein ACTSSJ_02015 [Candidatus Odinarchaeia archaeon]
MSRKKHLALLLFPLLMLPLLLLSISPVQAQNTSIQVKPVAIVYSNCSFYWDPIENPSDAPVSFPLYVLEGHLYGAGIPFQVINESQLTNLSFLENFSCIIFPYQNKWFNSSNNRENAAATLRTYVENGGAVLGLGFIAFKNETNDFYSNSDFFIRDFFIRKVFNIKYLYNASISGTFNVILRTHYITRDYSDEHFLFTYTDTALNQFLVNDTSIETYVFGEVRYNDNNVSIFGAASKIGLGRSVFFGLLGLNHLQYLDRSFLLIRAIQWCIFGDDLLPIGLNLSPGKIIWVPTIDQDWCFKDGNTTSALSRLLNWSREYHFTFGWAVISDGPVVVGTSNVFQGHINWTAVKPLILEAYYDGNDIASHSVTHVYWDQVNVSSERDSYEIIGSKQQLEGNLSIPIYGLQVWGPGIFYPRYNASYLVLEAGYKYVTELPVISDVSHFPVMFGYEFYFYNYTNLNFTHPLPVFWRATHSDNEYFSSDQLNLTWQEAFELEKQLFDSFYPLGHSFPYIFLWHDYSLDNQSRIPYFLNVIEYELWNRTDVYPCSPYELWKRMHAMNNLRFNVSYSQNGLKVYIDASNVGSDFINYTAGMSLLIDNSSIQIGSVNFNGDSYPAFSSNKVILSKLNIGVNEIDIQFGSPETSRLIHSTLGGMEQVSEVHGGISIKLFRQKMKTGRLFIESNSSPQIIFVDGVPSLNWTYTNGLLVINVSAENGCQVDVFFENLIEVSPTVAQVYTAMQPLTVTLPLTNNYPYPLTFQVTVTISGPSGVFSSTKLVTLNSGDNQQLVFEFDPPEEGWVNGFYSVSVEGTNETLSLSLITQSYPNLINVWTLPWEILLTATSVFWAITGIGVSTYRKIPSDSADKFGRYLSKLVSHAGPWIFILGLNLVLGYHVVRVLPETWVNVVTVSWLVSLATAVVGSSSLEFTSSKFVEKYIHEEEAGFAFKTVKDALKISTLTVVPAVCLSSILGVLMNLPILEVAVFSFAETLTLSFLLILIRILDTVNKKTAMLLFLAPLNASALALLYLSYILGFLSVLAIPAAFGISTFLIYTYLKNEVFKPEKLPVLEEPLIKGDESYSLLSLSSILIFIFLFMTYFISWFFMDQTSASYVLALNSNYTLILILIQVFALPSIAVSGYLLSNIRRRINDTVKNVRRWPETKHVELSILIKQCKQTVLLVAISGIGMAAVLFILLPSILDVFNISPAYDILLIQLSLIGVPFTGLLLHSFLALIKLEKFKYSVYIAITALCSISALTFLFYMFLPQLLILVYTVSLIPASVLGLFLLFKSVKLVTLKNLSTL